MHATQKFWLLHFCAFKKIGIYWKTQFPKYLSRLLKVKILKILPVSQKMFLKLKCFKRWYVTPKKDQIRFWVSRIFYKKFVKSISNRGLTEKCWIESVTWRIFSAYLCFVFSGTLLICRQVTSNLIYNLNFLYFWAHPLQIFCLLSILLLIISYQCKLQGISAEIMSN